ncbi:MAG: hypothetical protein ACP5OA_07430 [Candidatus Woesearchaeota archaeon]
MRLTAWTWLIFGGIISIMSGYIYLFVPKNGEHNNAMGLFFFIGIVFIITGIIKLFFKKIDDESVFESAKISEQKNPEKVIQIPVIETKPNKIDEAVNQMLRQHEPAGPQHQPAKPNAVHNTNRSNHTNSFSHIYQYKGPIHAPGGTHTQHQVSQHTAAQTSAARHPIHNTEEHGIKCHRCGNVNSGHSNYCHQCGNRLR